MAKRRHMVLFNTDQCRSDAMGHMGDPAALTRNLDRLVETDAVPFRYAFCQNPVCTPSRRSFMSSWYPHVRAHRTMFHMMRQGEPVFLRTLKGAGCHVGWGGKNDLVPGEFGYADYCSVKYEPSESVRPMWMIDRENEWRGELGDDRFYSFHVGGLNTEPEEPYHDGDWANVMRAIDLIKNAPSDQPLCIYLPLTDPHPPYAVDDPWCSMIDRTKLPSRLPTPRSGAASLAFFRAYTADRPCSRGTRSAGLNCAPPAVGCARGSISRWASCSRL